MIGKRMTAPQREVLRALRALGELVVTPDDARPLKALRRRGLVRYKRRDGVRIAQLRLRTSEEKAVKARTYNVPREFLHLFWAGWNWARLNKRAKV